MSTQTMKDFAMEFRTELAGPYGRSMIGAFLALLAIILPLIWTNLTMGVVMVGLLMVSAVLMRWPVHPGDRE